MLLLLLLHRIKHMKDKTFLSRQVITYIGNKRSLLKYIDGALVEIKKDLKKEHLISADLFSGSGIVSRLLKQHSIELHTNDLEDYARVINECYLSNKEDVDFNLLKALYKKICLNRDYKTKKTNGFISELYAPVNDDHIKKDERVFYTSRNARYIDSTRQLISTFPKEYQKYFIAPLLYEASKKTNTCGVFKGFYKNSDTDIGQFGGNGKNALSRIKANIKIDLPVFSDFSCKTFIHQKDANDLVNELPHLDIAYIDPPYNQHPYGSNYFMLNLITNYSRPTNISKVSGIPIGWNKSNYNKKTTALEALIDLCKKINSTYLIISYNSEGFIKKTQMLESLRKLGKTRAIQIKYNAFRGSRNLNERNIHVNEFLFIVKKGSQK